MTAPVAPMTFAYLVASVCFILTLQGLSSPDPRPAGQLLGGDRHAGRRGRHAALTGHHRPTSGSSSA